MVLIKHIVKITQYASPNKNEENTFEGELLGTITKSEKTKLLLLLESNDLITTRRRLNALLFPQNKSFKEIIQDITNSTLIDSADVCVVLKLISPNKDLNGKLFITAPIDDILNSSTEGVIGSCSDGNFMAINKL